MVTSSKIFSGIDPITLAPHDVFQEKNFLGESHFNLIKSYVESYVQLTSGTHFENKSIQVNGERRAMIGAGHYRSYLKHFDLSHWDGYWSESSSTIEATAWRILPTQTHPAVIKLIKKCHERLGEDWIPFRCIINVLEPGKPLDGHFDGSIFKTREGAPCYSFTFYTHVPAEGGSLWTSSGLLLPPIENAVVYFEGSQLYHGVTAVKSATTRLALTIRFFRARDLLFPTDAPLLYNPS